MKKIVKKLLSIILCLAMIISASVYGAFVPGNAYAQTVEELEQELASVDAELERLKGESDDTEEYLRVLNKRLDNLNKQYTIVKNEVTKTDNTIKSLESSIKKNNENISKLRDRIVELEAESQKLNAEFEECYVQYFRRMRAMYVSGDLVGSLGFLLDSEGLSQFLTRLEMISAISRKDNQLMQNIQRQSKAVADNRSELQKNEESLLKSQTVLESDSNNLKLQQKNLAIQQSEMEQKQTEIEAQRLETNKVLNQIYSNTEFYEKKHDAIMQEIDDAIAAADEKYNDSSASNTTTEKPTSPASTSNSQTTSNGSSTTATTKTPTTSAQPSGVLKMCYPCPDYTYINCGFGDYAGHTGCDFATGGKVNQRIVAAESGTVIVSADLTNPDGTYRSYGRYIVIRHDKKNKEGKTVYTLYAHNNARLVDEGEYVSKGQQIALSGSTGNSTGPHLHFEVRVGGTQQSFAVNPKLYLP